MGKITGFYAPNKKYVSQIYRIRHEKQFNNELWGHTMTMWQTSMFGQVETAGKLDINALNKALKEKTVIKLRPLKYKKHHKLLKEALEVQKRSRESTEMWYKSHKTI